MGTLQVTMEENLQRVNLLRATERGLRMLEKKREDICVFKKFEGLFRIFMYFIGVKYAKKSLFKLLIIKF